MKTKTFQCEECKDFFPKYKFDQFGKKLVDNKKFWHGKIVCKRCYNKFYYNRKYKEYIQNGI